MSAEALNLPPVNEAEKERERLCMFGSSVNVRFHLPSGEIVPLQFNAGTEVKNAKKLLEKAIQISHKTMSFYYNDRLLIDPISMCDAWGADAEAEHFDVHVRLSSSS